MPSRTHFLKPGNREGVRCRLCAILLAATALLQPNTLSGEQVPVRQKEGLSYGINSVFHASPRDKSSQFLMYAICNPQNIDKVDKAIAEEHFEQAAELRDELKQLKEKLGALTPG